MALQNGQLPSDMLASIGDGQTLGILAAAQWKKLVRYVEKKYGWTPRPSPGATGYRSLAQQIQLLKTNYDHTYRAGATISNGGMRLWDGKVWYKKPDKAVAATPGSSNHGWGNAVDVRGLGNFGSTAYNQFKEAAEKHGFTNTEGSKIKEPWHWVYDGTTITPLDDGDDMTEEQLQQAVAGGIWIALSEAANPAEGDAGKRGRGIRNAIRAIVQPTVEGEVNKVLDKIGGAPDGDSVLKRLLRIENKIGSNA